MNTLGSRAGIKVLRGRAFTLLPPRQPLLTTPRLLLRVSLPVMRSTTLLTMLALPVIALAASITSGQSYKITNSKGGTVVDLSAGDNTSSAYSSTFSRMHC